ncbi:uncharacterized protein J8A68_004950 [[Candida] subhashii]|uniref:JmjC domain-containing protein n=1 Tax=[Candida] subhashii TaxID=561895 RepID=A0A8J5Q8P4_9ASCO|nr:uncharacterized protein J8A68_004950 [[Candida] subhashii]KAG7661491.1 hypothetical protein J8A68_004950 [[Candida] subhashii]
MPNTKPDPKRKKTINEYKSHTVPNSPSPKIPVLESIPSAQQFFNDFIRPRKPVKFTVSPIIKSENFTIANLETTLDYDSELQVEKKYEAGFGSGQKRVKMALRELVDEIKAGNDGYYLTTQYDFDGPDAVEEDNDDDEDELEDFGVLGNEDGEEEGPGLFDKFSETSSMPDISNLHDDFEDDFEQDIIQGMPIPEIRSRIRELYQPPLTNLVHSPEILPTIPDLFSSLIPQQINIWMGSTSPGENQFAIDPKDEKLGLGKQLPGKIKGTSSGLHHDHADNLYVPISGRKRFTLFSPADALKLSTVGEIRKIYNSGIIDYEPNENAVGWRSLRDDGAMVEEIIRWKLDSLEEEEQSEERRKLLEELQWMIKNRKSAKKSEEKRDPPSFSKIPPALLHLDDIEDVKTKNKIVKFAEEHFPGFLELNKYVVWLEPGEMLYLPAGWFHEVSSFASSEGSNNVKDRAHIAINYWFIPPNSDEFKKCYSDSYWTEDWERTQKAIDLVRAGEVYLNDDQEEEGSDEENYGDDGDNEDKEDDDQGDDE